MAQPNLSNQSLEARTVGRRGTRAALIIIDHFHPLARPAELQGTLDQSVLQAGRFLVLFDLPQGRLPDVDDC